MSCPMQHDLIVGAIVPILKRKMNYRETNLQFHDYYVEEYKRFGIDRSEMMAVMPAVMTVDVLVGCDKLEYVGEAESREK